MKGQEKIAREWYASRGTRNKGNSSFSKQMNRRTNHMNKKELEK